VLNHCYESGLNLFDTANSYSNGLSEEILGKAIKKYGWRRENIVVATKVWTPVGRGLEDPLAMTDDKKDRQCRLREPIYCKFTGSTLELQ
jgi:aryl-alcohol dehydrogenase-like predicted oxidoreductase